MQKCHDRVMSLSLLSLQRAVNTSGRMEASRTRPHLQWLNALAQCGEEQRLHVDKFMFAVMREAEKTAFISRADDVKGRNHSADLNPRICINH